MINCWTQIQRPAGAMDLTPYINLIYIILVASHLCICVRVLELCICICVFVFVQMYLSCSEHPKRHQRKLPRALEKLLVLRKLFLHPAEMLNIAEHCSYIPQKCWTLLLRPADMLNIGLATSGRRSANIANFFPQMFNVHMISYHLHTT